MKTLKKPALMALALVLFFAAAAEASQRTVGLGTARSYAVLAGSTITNTGPTTITGDVGLHPGTSVTGFNSATLNGDLHKTDASAKQAKTDLVTAYNDAAGRTPVTTIATELGGKTLKAGVYDSAAGTFGITGTLTLNAQGNANAVWVFKMASTLVTASSSKVALINGANGCNIFWKVGSSATLGTGSTLRGTVMALTSITLDTSAKLFGRALARNGAVTLRNNTIDASKCTTGRSTTSATNTTTSTTSDLPATGGWLPIWPILAAGIGLILVGLEARRGR